MLVQGRSSIRGKKVLEDLELEDDIVIMSVYVLARATTT